MTNKNYIPHNLKELIIVVNDKDIVVSQVTRERVHREGLLHREAYVFIFNKNNQLLLQLRDGGLYDCSSSGHVSRRETYLQAIQSEVKEELGLNLRKHKFKNIFKKYYRHIKNGQSNFRLINLFDVKGNFNLSNFKIDNLELEDIEFLDILKIKNLIVENPQRFKQGFLASFRDYCKVRNL